MALSLNTVTLSVLGFQCVHFGETVQFIVLLQLYHLPKSSHPLLSSGFMESLFLNTAFLLLLLSRFSRVQLCATP